MACAVASTTREETRHAVSMRKFPRAREGCATGGGPCLGRVEPKLVALERSQRELHHGSLTSARVGVDEPVHGGTIHRDCYNVILVDGERGGRAS